MFFDEYTSSIQSSTSFVCLRSLEHRLSSCFIRSNKQAIKDLKKQSSKSYHYGITFTCDPKNDPPTYIPLLAKRLMSLAYVKPDVMCGEHLSTNAHLHLYVKSDKYISVTKLRKLNRGMRTELINLKGLAIVKWRNYCLKQEDDKTIYLQ